MQGRVDRSELRLTLVQSIQLILHCASRKGIDVTICLNTKNELVVDVSEIGLKVDIIRSAQVIF
jgi:hypothetical protein